MKIDSSDKRWNEYIQAICTTFGHTQTYNRLLAKETSKKIYLFVAEKDGETVCLPYCERTFQDTIDVFSPFGWSGFAPSGSNWAWAAWDAFAQDENYICSYFVSNPGLSRSSLDFYEQIYHYAYVINLQDPIDKISKNLSSTNRNLINKGLQDDREITYDRVKIASFFEHCYLKFARKKSFLKFTIFPINLSLI